MPPTIDHGNDDGSCCPPDSGECCGPGSWCHSNAGDHDHPSDEVLTVELVHPIRVRRFQPGPVETLEALVDRLSVFVPDNYLAAEDPMRMSDDFAVIAGWDHLGWTLERYVLPRLATGLLFPLVTGPVESFIEFVLNSFDEGYRSISDELDPTDNGQLVDHAEGRRDCIDFVLANFAHLQRVDHDRSFRHGEDFYLTRNGHGTGFRDRGYGEIGRALTEAAKVYGPTT